MPMVKLNQAIKKVSPDGLLEVIATDRGALTDIPSWCNRMGHVLIESNSDNGTYNFLIRRIVG